MAENLATELKRIPRYLYRGQVRQLISRSGLDPYAKRAYFELYRATTGGTDSVEFRGVTTEFEIDTYYEYHVVDVADNAERPVFELLLDHLEPDDVFYDVGANIGTYTCVMGNALDDGTVVSFEPYPPNVDRLRSNVALNGLDVEVQPVALSSSASTVEFHILDSEASGTQEGSIDPDYADLDRAVTTTEVDTVAGDSLVEDGRIPAPNVLKMDVEGAGVDVIRGLEATLARDDCRILCLEPHGNRETLESLVEDLGFDVERVTLTGGRETGEPMLFARKR